MCTSTPLDRLHVNKRPDHRTRLESGDDLHGTRGRGEALRKRVIVAVPAPKSDCPHAGLAGIPIFRGDRPLDYDLGAGVVEHDKGRVAAQFERELLDRPGASLHRQSADFGRAGEGKFENGGIRGQLAADLPRSAGPTQATIQPRSPFAFIRGRIRS